MRRADLEEYAQLTLERKRLERQEKTLKDRIDQLAELFRSELESKGKDTVKQHGFSLSLVPGSASVPWAKEYLLAMGPEKVDELKQAAAAQATTKKLVITLPHPE